MVHIEYVPSPVTGHKRTSMPKFNYKAFNEDEKMVTGTMIGATVEEVTDRLTESDFTRISVTELNFDGSIKEETLLEKLNFGLSKIQSHIPLKIVVFFTRQLATMIEAGVPISEALLQLAEGEKPAFKTILL
jgi:type II secretory pathway component PulF